MFQLFYKLKNVSTFDIYEELNDKSDLPFLNVSLLIQNSTFQKNRFITISTEHLGTADDFIRRISEITSGLVHGSDALDLDESIFLKS